MVMMYLVAETFSSTWLWILHWCLLGSGIQLATYSYTQCNLGNCTCWGESGNPTLLASGGQLAKLWSSEAVIKPSRILSSAKRCSWEKALFARLLM